jgi:hypothetical protein
MPSGRTWENLRAPASITQELVTPLIGADADMIAFFERVYFGALFSARDVVRHRDWIIVPRAMYPEDWNRLSVIMGGFDLREHYRREHGAPPNEEWRGLAGTAPPYSTRTRRPYARHYEIEPLSLPD